MKLNTLVISFYFPPFNRVGGRRWAKHLKYFKQQDENFHVLAGQYEGKSPWDRDIESYKENITRVPVKINYPYYKKTLPKNIFQKIYWKLSLNYWHYIEKKSKGNLWDDSNGSRTNFLSAASDIIKHKKINHVLLSVGPFHYSTILVELKKLFPHITFTIDYRDYWEDELHSLTEKQKEYEYRMQQSVLDKVDLILTPNDEITSYFRNTKEKKSVYTLPHCYDPGDLPEITNVNTGNKEIITFLYGGALYNKMQNYVSLYCDFVSEIQKTKLKTRTSVFTAQPGYTELLSGKGIDYTMQKYLSVHDYFQQILSNDYILMFRPDWSPNAFSSKYYELLAFRKPILYFGPHGDVSKHLEENMLGFHFTEKNFSSQVQRFLANMTSKQIPDKNYNLGQHTFEFQTKKLIDALNSHYKTNAKSAILS